MKSRSGRIGALLVVLAMTHVIGCGDVDRFPSTSVTLKPDAITDVALAFDESDGSLVVTWTAPETRGGTDGLRRYDLRFEYSSDFDWTRAERVASPPVPGAAGEAQTYRFTYPRRGHVLSAAIRSIDNSGNLSEMSNVAASLVPGISLTGTSANYLTGEPDDVLVTLTTPEYTRTERPDPSGRWSFSDLPETALSIRFSGTVDPPVVFPVEIEMTLTEDTDLDVQMIPYRENEVYPSFSMLELFKRAVRIRSGDPVLRTWPSRPVDVFVSEHVTPGGLDYRTVAIAAVDRWMELTGIELFRVVEAPPPTGVTLEFLSAADMGSQIGFTKHTNTADGTPLRSDISIVNTFEDAVALNRVMLHELGHTIRLDHLPAGFLMYAGQPLPDDPTEEEVWIVRLLNAIPDRTDLSIHREVGK